MIVHEHGKWVLKTKDGSRVLGKHATKEEAEAQERAVQASKHSDDLSIACPSCGASVPADSGGTLLPHMRADANCEGSGASWRRPVTDRADALGEVVQRFEAVERVDSALAAPEKRSNGFVRLEGRIAKIGVQVYRNDDGSQRRELRLPEDVFADAALKSFAMMPVTNQHPHKLLDATDAKVFAVGSVGEPRRDGEMVAAPMTFWDAKVIEDIKGGRRQLSCGYDCQLEQQSGTWRGERFDVIQRRIEGNHVAVVDAARAGPMASLRLDQVGGPQKTPVESFPTGDRHMALVRIDGLSIEVKDENAANAQAIVDRALAAAKKSGEDLAATEKVRADEAVKKIDELKAQHDALKEKFDAGKMIECDECDGTGKVDGEKCDECGGKGEYAAPRKDDAADVKAARKKVRKDARAKSIAKEVARVTAGAKARAELESKVKPHVGAEFKFDGVSDLDLRKAAIGKLRPDLKLDGFSDGYIEARLDGILEDLPKGVGSAASDAARALASAHAAQVAAGGGAAKREDAAPTNPQEAAAAHRKRSEAQAWGRQKQ